MAQIIKIKWQDVGNFRSGMWVSEAHNAWNHIISNMPEKFRALVENIKPELTYVTIAQEKCDTFIPFRFTCNSSVEELEKYLEEFIIHAYWESNASKIDWAFSQINNLNK